MPYIAKERRSLVKVGYKPGFRFESAGELNYLFTETLIRYMKDKGLSYQTINDIVGALEGCKMEFIRRVVNTYEDSKITENGDCY